MFRIFDQIIRIIRYDAETNKFTVEKDYEIQKLLMLSRLSIGKELGALKWLDMQGLCSMANHGA